MESLRLCPPVPWLFRMATIDGHIDGVFVPKGTMIYIPVSMLLFNRGCSPFFSRSVLSTPLLIYGVLTQKSGLTFLCQYSAHGWFPIFRFRPERWLPLPETYDSTFSLMTFKAGPRACIGKQMAIIEMKAVLLRVVVFLLSRCFITKFYSNLIANFEFKPSYTGQEAQPTAMITMSKLFSCEPLHVC